MMKIFASDYDGTLRTSELVAQHDKQAIEAWQKQGNLFGIVSGRSMESMQAEALKNDLHADFYIGNNGGAIYDQNFKEIKVYFFPFHKALDILAYIRKERTISYVINDGFYRAKRVIDEQREDKKYANTKTTKTEAEILEARKIAQLVISLDSQTDCQRIADYINATYSDVACAYRNINCVDVAPYGISKATGLAYMAAHFHVDTKNIYTIGDSYNDIPMLSTFYGFAMNSAANQVKSYAKTTADDVADALHCLLG